jgi:mono/diheme cytochrome c family protein
MSRAGKGELCAGARAFVMQEDETRLIGRFAMHHFEMARGARFQFGVLVLLALIFGFGGAAAAQDKQIKKEPIKTVPANSGAEMFKEYCAVCHGKTGKGDGPAASALKQAPANLTTLAQRHDGKFPEDYVANVLRNGVKAPAHGDAEMPVWGPLFRSMNPDELFMYIRISSVMSYIKSLQVK